MRLPFRSACLLSLFATSGAIAADLLPLKSGIYVPVGRPCKGAANSEIVNYWGGRSSIGAAQVGCMIKTVSRKGNVFTIKNKCRDIQSGGGTDADPTVLTIGNPSNFRMGGTSYRYCGKEVQF